MLSPNGPLQAVGREQRLEYGEEGGFKGPLWHRMWSTRIVALLSIDFHALEQDVNKEQQLRYNTVYCKILFALTGHDEYYMTFGGFGVIIFCFDDILCSSYVK